MDGINDATEEVLKFLSSSALIEEYTLVGGTALSLQINHRMSRDLDFCIWQDRIGIKQYEIRWDRIEKLFESEYQNVTKDLLDLQQVNYFTDDVKVTFFVREDVNSRIIKTKNLFNRIRIATVKSIGAMKLELIQRRNTYRDYYDIYSILKENRKLEDLIKGASSYCGHKFKTKNMEAILTSSQKFEKEKEFNLLEPKYDVSAKDIEDYILKHIREEKIRKGIIEE